jgi:hypothetical protein
MKVCYWCGSFFEEDYKKGWKQPCPDCIKDKKKKIKRFASLFRDLPTELVVEILDVGKKELLKRAHEK